MRICKTQAIWLLLLIFDLLNLFLRVSGIRNDIGFQQKRFCRNTVHGRYLLTDDNGYVCHSLSVDVDSRCCPQSGEKFSCQGCDHLTQCCNSYEYCVSCCLNPSKTLKSHIIKLKIAKPATAGTYSSVFDFCAGRCRHNSESVVHENAYLSDYHHCFSMASMARGSEIVALGENYTQPDSRLNGINVIVGRQGESCDSVCKLSGQSCVPNKLLLLNQCEIMQKYMRCRGACLESIGADQPALVVDNAPKHLNPGACLYTRTQSSLSCDGYHLHTRRLCPCA